jgi:hypothetical protein
LRYGAADYRVRSEGTSTLLLQLFEGHHLEATLMPDLLGQLTEETIEQFPKKLPVEKRLKGLSPDDLLAALSPETRAALAPRLKDYGSRPNADAKGPDRGDAIQ